MTDSASCNDSIDETARRKFEAAWAEGPGESIARFLPADDSPSYLATLRELVCIELEFRWRSWPQAQPQEGADTVAETAPQPPCVESYLQRFPRLNRPDILVDLLAQERAVRRQAGDAAPIDEYERRFPALVTADKRLVARLEAVERPTEGLLPSATCPATIRPDRPPGVTLPIQFGNYQLLAQIGRGGMGVVYRARQCSADRIVALKVIRREFVESPSHDTQTSALERFRHEAQAAARLDHENIVTVHDVGDVDGEPFFSMQYVEGRSLADIVRDGPISNLRAASYIEAVARAVQHAHHQGILHRDLKPQNILVDAETDRPLVADFGLAKLSGTGPELTQSGDVIGSPPYMSPEQVRDSSRVTVETDVYALGATLYHILTGRPPFQAATSVDTLRQVLDQEPVLPRRLNSAIDRDLETITLKCLQKEPALRFDSANALADDLHRYRNGEPIQARPVGMVERSVRWCRRNPMVASLIGSTVTFLLLALAASLIGYLRTSAALDQAEAGYHLARSAVDRFFTQVSENSLLNQPGMQPLRRQLLRQALDYYQQFLHQRGNDPAIQDELARTHFRVGRITELLDSPDAALASYHRALTLQQQLAAAQPNDLATRQALGNTLSAMGGVLFKQGKFRAAQARHDEAIAIRTVLAEAQPQQTELQRTLANSYMNLGLVERARSQFEQARKHFETAQAIRHQALARDPHSTTTRRDLAMGSYNLANLCLSLKPRDLSSAEANFQQAITAFEDLLREAPRDLANQYRLAVSCRMLGDLKCYTHDPAAARNLYRRAHTQMTSLARGNPDVPEYQWGLACLDLNLGQLENEQDHASEAVNSFHRAHEVLKQLVDQYPNIADYRRDLAVTLLAIADLEINSGQQQSARDHLTAAHRHAQQLIRQFPDNTQYHRLADQLTSRLDNLAAAQQ